MKIGKAALILALPVVAGYAAAKSYVYYKARATIDRVVAQAAILGDLKYGGISSNLSNGTVQVDRLVFTPRGISDTVTVRSLSLSTGSFVTLLNLARQSDGKKPPESLAVRFDDLTLAADGEILQFADRLSQASAAAAGAQYSSPHCGDQAVNGLGIIQRLGYDTLTLDGTVGYRVEESTGSVAVSTEIDIRDMAHVGTRVVLASAGGMPNFTRSPTFKEFDISYKDLSYKDRLKRFCARAANISEEEYLQAQLEHGALQQQFGITPGPGLREAYRDFLQTPNAELRVQFHPSETFDPRGVTLYRPKDVLRQLNATLTVNNKPIEDLSFEFGAPTPAPQVAHAPTKRTDTPTDPKQTAIPAYPPATAPSSGQEEYRTVRVGDLSRYVDYYVRLHEAGQEPREGVLTQVSGGVAHVERRYGTGKITVKVRLRSVARAEIRL
jgi:hypothetical protein